MDPRERVGLNLQRLRRDKGLTQEDLSGRSGVHQTYLSGVERGKRNPTVMAPMSASPTSERIEVTASGSRLGVFIQISDVIVTVDGPALKDVMHQSETQVRVAALRRRR